VSAVLVTGPADEIIAPRRRFRLSLPARIALGVLVFLYLGALLAPFIAPYSPRFQDRENPYHPPTRLHWSQGLIVHGSVVSDPFRRQYREDDAVYRVRLLSGGHLLSVESPGRGNVGRS